MTLGILCGVCGRAQYNVRLQHEKNRHNVTQSFFSRDGTRPHYFTKIHVESRLTVSYDSIFLLSCFKHR